MYNVKALQSINGILKKLNSTTIHLHKSLDVLTLPASGYLLFFMHLHKEFGCFPLEYVQNLDLPNVTGKALIDRIDDNLPNYSSSQ